MNKTLLSVLLLVFAITLSGQSGLLDLSYGITKAETLDHLSDIGFTAVFEDSTNIYFVPADNKYVDTLLLRFKGDLLHEWTIMYLDQDLEDIETLVLSALIARHGEDYYWDGETGRYFWDLSAGHRVYAEWVMNWKQYWVSYKTE